LFQFFSYLPVYHRSSGVERRKIRIKIGIDKETCLLVR